MVKNGTTTKGDEAGTVIKYHCLGFFQGLSPAEFSGMMTPALNTSTGCQIQVLLRGLRDNTRGGLMPHFAHNGLGLRGDLSSPGHRGILLCVTLYTDLSIRGIPANMEVNRPMTVISSFHIHCLCICRPTPLSRQGTICGRFAALPPASLEFFATASTILLAQAHKPQNIGGPHSESCAPPGLHVPEQHNIMGMGMNQVRILQEPWHGDSRNV